METRIGRWHNRSKAYGDVERATAAARALERSQADILQALDEALVRTLGDDDTVYVVRSVEAQRVAIAAESTAAQQTALIGRQLAASVSRTILRDAGDGQNLMRFDNEAQFAAHFIRDLIQDRAWGRWYYGAFARLREVTLADTVRAVIASRSHDLARLLGYLSRWGSLDAVLALLGNDAALKLARDAVARSAPTPDLSLRPLFVTAVAIFRSLGWLVSSRSTALIEAHFARFVSRGSVDWKDRAALTTRVIDAMWLLIDAGVARHESTLAAPAIDPGLRAQLDWLDVPRLEEALAAMAKPRPDEMATVPADSTAGPLAPSARMMDLGAALVSAIRASGVTFNQDEGHTTLRILAALDVHCSRWSNEPLAIELVVQLCAVACCAVHSGNPALVARALDGQADLTGWIDTSEGARLNTAVQGLRRLRASRHELFAAIVSSAKRQPESVQSIATDCAGVFLLTRALLDARIHHVLGRAGHREGLRFVLALLGLCWAGSDTLDAGLALWAGFDTPPTAREIAEGWLNLSEDASFHRELKQLLARAQPAEGEKFASTLRALNLPEADVLTVSLLSAALLRLWASWLRGFSGASVEYLLENMVRRSGGVSVNAETITVTMADKPLDIVLEMAGYLAPTLKVPWLGDRVIRFKRAQP